MQMIRLSDRPRVVKFYRKGRYFMLKVAEKSVSPSPSLAADFYETPKTTGGGKDVWIRVAR